MSDTTTKERVMAGAPTPINGEDLTPDEVMDRASDAAKDRWIGIFVQLTNSHRFNKFLEDNYVIQDKIDEEKKTIETLVIEKPIAIGPQLSSAQLNEIRTLLKISGAKHPEGVFSAILKLLGQDGPTIIEATTGSIEELCGSLKGKLDA